LSNAEIIFEQLEERIVLDGAVVDVSLRPELFGSHVAGADADLDGGPEDLSFDAAVDASLDPLAIETGTEWLPDGTWHYWEQDWDASGNGYRFDVWEDGSSSFHQIQWDAALNSKGTHNGFDYNLQRDGSWTYQAVQWDASQNGYSYDATSTGTYTYEAEQWQDGKGYSYVSDSNGNWEYHTVSNGNEPGDVVEFKSDSGGWYEFTYTWANGYSWTDTSNHLPTPVALSVNGSEDAPVPITGWSMTDVDTGDTLASVTITSLPDNGTLKLNNTNVTLNQVISSADFSKVTFVPNANWNGSTSFTYKATDSQGGTSASAATATINVGAMPDLVADINPGSAGSYISNAISVNGTLFFVADDGIHGPELWKSDGTPSGTALVKDINPGDKNSSIDKMTDFNGTLYFTADDGNQPGDGNKQIWKSDGTESGTVRVSTISFASFGLPDDLTPVNNILYFFGYNWPLGEELWKTDGTDSGTVPITDLKFDWWPSNLTPFGASVYFSAGANGKGTELWKSDGTKEGTVMVRDINYGSGSSNPDDLLAIGDILYFSADDGIHGRELWRTDGTASGTSMVKDIIVGSTGSKPSHLINFDGVLCFVAENQLWRSDGTPSNTTFLADMKGPWGNYYIGIIDGTLYTLNAGWGYDFSLWKSDGTPTGTSKVLTYHTAYPELLEAFEGAFYFSRDDGVHGEELWRLEPSTNELRMVADINPGEQWAYLANLTNVNDTLFFTADDGVHGSELWVL